MSTRHCSNKRRKLSTRLIRKGALIEETYAAFQHWELGQAIKDNLHRIQETNAVGAKNARWLREIVATLSSRFTDEESLRPLVILALGNFPLDKWRLCLLWQIGTVDELYYRFATEWLYQEHRAGTYSIRTEDVIPFVRMMTDGRIASGKKLSEYGATRAARDLLLMAADFGLLQGTQTRHFTSYHLPEESFLYFLHIMAEQEPNANRLVHSPDWRMFLMSPEDVERELFRLHQYRKLQYDVAGSLAQLTLPCRSPIEYARELVA